MAKKVEELVVKGMEWTKQLQVLIKDPCGDDVSLLEQKKLVDNIIGSLNEAIFVINNGSCEYSGEIFQIPGSIHVDTPISDDRRSVDSGQSCKRLKDRKSGFKKRKSSDSWIKISSSTVDEYAWRKYGQKEILNSTFPRGYFRCTHKFDQGCKATKQVQKIQDEPIKYQITYSSNHTCQQTVQPNQVLQNIILDSYPEESKLFNFQPNTPSEIYPSPSCPNSTKEENIELEVQSNYTSEPFPPLDIITLSDLTSLISSDINDEFLPGVYSYASSIDSHGMDMDLFSNCDDFVNSFQSQ